MKVAFLTFVLLVASASFSQDHVLTIKGLFANNEFIKAASYIENNKLTKIEGYRFYYWDTRRRASLHLRFDSEEVLKDCFGEDGLSTEYQLCQFTDRLFGHLYTNFDEEEYVWDLRDYLDTMESEITLLNDFYMLMAFGQLNLDAYDSCQYYCEKILETDSLFINANLYKSYAMFLESEGVGSNYLQNLGIEKELYSNNPRILLCEYSIDHFFKDESGYQESIDSVYIETVKKSPEEKRYSLRYLDYQDGYHRQEEINEFVKKRISEYPSGEFVYSLEHHHQVELDYIKTINDCKLYLEEYGEDLNVISLLAYSYHKNNEYKKAILNYTILKKRNYINSLEQVYLAKSYYEEEEYNNSLTVCLEELNANAYSKLGFYTIAFDVFMKKKKVEKALRYLRVGNEKTDLDGFFTEDYHRIVLLEELLSREEWEREFGRTISVYGKGFYTDHEACIINYFYKKKYNKNFRNIQVRECDKYILAQLKIYEDQKSDEN